MKVKVALVRGKFLNKYEMQTFEYLTGKYDITAFGSITPFHDKFSFPVEKLPSPMDLPEFPFKMQLLNRVFIDAHYLIGLEKKLRGYDIAHTAETYYRYTQQCLDAKDKGFVKKVVVTVLENIPHNNEGIWGRKGFKERTRNNADVLIALTKKSKQALISEGADPDKIQVIGSGIDIHKFHPKNNTTDDKISVLFVGRFEEYKGVFDALHAAKNIIQTNQNLSFVFVGNGSKNKEMEALARDLGIEKFVQFKSLPYEKLPQVYQEADIFVAPSCDTTTWQEQYGYMLLEAQASGLAIVTTNSGSIPEVVGDAALLVEQHDVQELTKSLNVFIESKKIREVYGKKSRERAVHVHDSRIIAKKIARVYESFL